MKQLPSVGASLLPGHDGTKKLQILYGEKLLCVRYRYDKEAGRRYKTVELIIEEGVWIPNRRRYRAEEVLPIKIHYREYELRERVKAAGGMWDRSSQTWRLSYMEIMRLNLGQRIVVER
jgi:hypothetical protein